MFFFFYIKFEIYITTVVQFNKRKLKEMGVRRRLLESRISWLFRVLSIEDVDFAIATDEAGNEWLTFLEDYTRNETHIAMHPTTHGPQIGRCVLREDKDVDKYTWKFCTRNNRTHVKHLEYRPDTFCDIMMLQDLHHVLRELGPHEGIHIYTDPKMCKWYAANDSMRDNAIHLRTKSDLATGHAQRGWVVRDLLDQYEGTWHMTQLSVSNKEVIDKTVEVTSVSKQPIRKAVRDMYQLSEREEDDSIVVLKHVGQGLSNKHSYRLTLDLTGVVGEGQVYNVYYLLNEIINAEFLGNNNIIVDLDRIDYVIDGENLHGMVMHGTHKNKYYFKAPQHAGFTVRENGLFPRTF